MQYDLVKLYREWCNLPNRSEGRNQALSDDDINLGLLKMKTTKDKWTTVSNQTQTLTRKVTLNKSPSEAAGAYGQVHTSVDYENVIRVTIHSGIIKGLNRCMKLPMDKNIGVLAETFGKKLEIDPSKCFSEVTQNRMTLEVAMEQCLKRPSEQVVVEFQGHDYKGHFSCDVAIKGPVTDRSGSQQTISGILEELKRKSQNPSRDLASLEFDGDNVVVKMTGEVELHWESDHKYKWQ